MDLCLLIAIACLRSSPENLSVEVLHLDPCLSPAVRDSFSHSLSAAQLKELARAITVRVRSQTNWGSGILIQRQGPVYLVVTNQHVLNAGEPFYIETPDGQLHAAQQAADIPFEDNDLALLQFRSSHGEYTVASWEGASTLAVGEPVFAAGYPSAAELHPPMQLVIAPGQISTILQSALVGGYQVGYTNSIQKGMSGGPLLNRRGKVVGINGMHQYPLWGNPYVFKDGSPAPPRLQASMVRSSWGIPAETFLQLAPQFSEFDPSQTLGEIALHCAFPQGQEHPPFLDFGS